MTKMYHLPLSLAVLPLALQAQTAPVEELLVTGTYSPRQEITAASTVVDEAEIQALNKRQLAGLLKTVPGLLVEEQGGPGGLTAVSIRGGEANFTQVLLDGVPINDPTNTRGGGFDFANLDPALVERIEVVRGAQSAIYGSDALAGVINIITRRPQEGHSQSISAEAGEDDYYRIGLRAEGREGDFDYALDLSRRDDGEPVEGSERESDSVNLRLGWQPGDRHSIVLRYRYLDGERSSYPEQSGGPELAQLDDLDETDYEDQVLALSWQLQATDSWRSTVTASRFEHDEDYTSPGIPPFFEVPPNGADTEFTRDEIQWVNSLQLAPDYQLDIGVDYRDEEGDSEGFVDFGVVIPTNFSLQRDSTGAFANLAAQPLEALLLNAGVRYDDPEDFDSQTSWLVGARYTLAHGFSVSANVGEAYKLPSFFALGNPLVGNPDLRPEKADSWDAGLAWQMNEELRLGATYFLNDFKDLVDFDDATFRNVNRQNVETSGVELEAYWLPMQNLSLRANGTYTDIDVKGEDTVLTGRPEWSAGLVAQWQVAADWQTTLDYRYTGEQWASSRHTGEEITEELDDYHRVDWTLHWQPLARWQFFLSLDNLLDEDYETAIGFPAPERAARLGARFTH